jgi:Secretion system C-terminal sorting domain
VELKGKGKGLKVYPNPVSSLLNVVYTEGSSFQILNLLGQQVLTGKTPPSGAGGLDVSALPQGTYILKVGAEQAKFLKQ